MEIMLSAPDGATEPWRIVRLAKIYRSFLKCVPKKDAQRVPCPHGVLGAVLRLHDEHGSLTALWYCERSVEILAPWLDRVWRLSGEDRITHVALQEGRLIRGDDPVWREWIAIPADILAEMEPVWGHGR
jgi:hypothetical protein